MEKYTKRFSVNEIQEILNKHMNVNNTRIHCLTNQNGMGWEGIQLTVYDEINKVQNNCEINSKNSD